MNKTYALVWNPNQGCWNAVGETARRRGKSSGGKCLATVAAVSLLGFAALPAHALPTGEAIASGKADIARGADGKSMSINQHTDKLVTQWQDFSVANGERVSFQQPNSQSIALNRVIGNNGSQIHGSIDANGRVFLVNPNGVLFGSGAQVNVGGLVASTKNLSDADFLANNFRFTGDSAQSVVNDGRITAADGGSVALLGARVANNGTIQAKLGNVALGAGNAFNVSFDGNGLLNLQVESGAVDAQASNGGLIQAEGGNVLMTARAADNLLNAVVNQTGTVEAKGLSSRGGKITLDGGTVNVGGKLDASWAQTSAPAGSVTTRGERVNVASNAIVDTRAGRATGTWTIEAANAGVNAATARGAGRSIANDTLSRNLGTTNVALTSTTGDLTVDGAVAWNSDNALALTARNGNVDLQQALSATGANARVSVNAADQIRINNAVKLTGENAALELNAKNGHTVDLDKAAVTLSGKNATFRANGDDYKVLHTVDDLRNMASDRGGRYVLGNAIDGNNTRFKSIGRNDGVFYGTFDGLGNTVARLVLSDPGSSSVGLFGFNTGRIANLSLQGITATTEQPYKYPTAIGALAGYNGGTISNVKATDVNVAGRGPAIVGGLVGANVGGTIDRATVTGRVSGDQDAYAIGGLVGQNLTLGDLRQQPATIRNSHADVRVTGARDGVIGGFVGANTGRIEHSTSAGTVSAADDMALLGGFVGINLDDGTIESSTSSANVRAAGRSEAIGGLAGINWGGIANSGATGSVTAGAGSIAGGLVASNGGEIRSSSASGNVVVAASGTAGGLVAINHTTGRIANAKATGSVKTGNDSWAGALAGSNAGDIDASVASGTVTAGANSVAGGFVGYNDDDGRIHASAARGNVSGAAGSTVGGFAGRNRGLIDTSSATGTVAALNNSQAGGFAGFAEAGTIRDSRASGNVSVGSGISMPLGSNSKVGGFAGAASGTLDKVHASGTVTAAYDTDAGGLVGYSSAAIKQSSASGNVKVVGGTSNAGGLVGRNLGDIDASSATGNVVGSQVEAGGLVGYNERGTITASTASGQVEVGGRGVAGGLVGTLGRGTVKSSSASGSVKGGVSSWVGGLVGVNGGTIDASSASGTVSGEWYAYVGGLVGSNAGGHVYRSTTSSQIANAAGYEQTAGTLAGINYGLLSGNSSTGSNGTLPQVGNNAGKVIR
ncbi:GLUG motif-containing protein [Burkholderia cenocepacia]|uniref:GLUG motif-containing protein n=1 Tax=Burkholderia cenocepacia TaxID=95486 RepID=UPI002AB7EAA2|nr:GLUG motif-containing protein [Burkholderia cenocepacia]